MFIVLLTYTRPLEAVDALVPAHREYLRAQYDAGTFLLSGRKEPRDGGVILANAPSMQAVHDVLADDPFHRHDVATYQVIEFIPSMCAAGLESMLQA